MTLRNTCESRIIDLLDRVFSTRKHLCHNEILVEGRDCGQDTIDRGWRKARGRAALVGCTKYRAKSLCLSATGEFTQILEQSPGMSRRKLLIREMLQTKK